MHVKSRNSYFPLDILTSKRLTGAILLTIFMFLFDIRLYAQISPGDLASPHSKLEGVSNCTKCHDLGKKVSTAKCLDCHKEIKTLIDNKKGYHSSSEVKSKECIHCHKDHHGKNFKMFRFDPNTFDHKNTTFELTGKHKDKKCVDCHQAKYISDAKYKNKKDTYLGLDIKCESCHEDYHQKTLSNDCSACHSAKTFKPADKFDHNKSKYKLTGKHIDIDCIKCHIKDTKNGKKFQEFTGLNFDNCAPCHKDVHKNKLGDDCKKCHLTSGFGVIPSNSTGFDHNKTTYPLTGKHIDVKCKTCHTTERGIRPKFALCTDCHKDKHNNQFNDKTGKLKDCKPCHNIDGYSPSLFSVEDHSKNKFQLLGGHLSVPCSKCHYGEQAKSWIFKDMEARCIKCHKNVHGNEIGAVFSGNDECEKCHGVLTWKKITFEHDSTKFKLLGKHTKTTCVKCHYPEISPGTREYKFKSLKQECASCHKDVHFAQFIIGEVTNCNQCHSSDNWKAVKFDHARTTFPLTGAHANIDCNRCHKEALNGSTKYILYKLGSFKCATCHK